MNEDSARRAGYLMTELRKYGATMPKPVVAAEVAATAALARIRAVENAASDAAINGAAIAALERGEDPLTDPVVLRGAAATRLVSGPNWAVVRVAGSAPLAEGLVEHADAVVDALRPKFDKAAAAIAGAAAQLGDVDLDDSAAVLRLGGQAAEAWRAVADSEKAILSAANVAKLLGQLAGERVESGYANSVIRWADVTSSALFQQLGKARPYAVVRAGVDLNLAGPTDLQRRIATLESDHVEQQVYGAGVGGAAVRGYRTAGSGRVQVLN